MIPTQISAVVGHGQWSGLPFVSNLYFDIHWFSLSDARSATTKGASGRKCKCTGFMCPRGTPRGKWTARPAPAWTARGAYLATPRLVHNIMELPFSATKDLTHFAKIVVGMFLQRIREPEVVQQGRRHLGGSALCGLRVTRYSRQVRRA